MIARALDVGDWQSFRDVRLHALQSCPGVYCTSLAEAEKRTESDWKALITGADRQIFGLCDDTLAGIAAVFIEGTTATIAMVFIRAAYRGHGHARLLLDACLAWAKANDIARVTITHRLSNQTMAHVVARYGFREFAREPRHWPDGTTEDEVSLELSLI